MTSENTCPKVTLSTTNPTSPDVGSNPGRHGEKTATNRLDYDIGLAVIIRLLECYSRNSKVNQRNVEGGIVQVLELVSILTELGSNRGTPS
jgi:hypothetical protein